MDETIKKMFDRIEPALNDETTSLIEKVEICVGYYIDQVLENPDFPFFMVNEVMAGKTTLPTISNMRLLVNSNFAKQLQSLQAEGKIAFQPVHLLWNLLGMIIFPILTRPQVLHMNYFNEDEFQQLMQERKKLIPNWINSIIVSSQGK